MPDEIRVTEKPVVENMCCSTQLKRSETTQILESKRSLDAG